MWHYMPRLSIFRSDLAAPFSSPPTARTPLLAEQRDDFQHQTTISSPQLISPKALPTPASRKGEKLLREYRTIFLICDRYTMDGTRWDETCQALGRFAEITVQYNPDGISIYFMNSELVGWRMRSKAQVQHLFDVVQPIAKLSTMDETFESILLLYNDRLELNQKAGIPPPSPINLVVITDSQTSDDPGVVIARVAGSIGISCSSLSQVGIQFIQVGDDPDTSEALEILGKELANIHKIRDIVDVIPYSEKLTAKLITKILLGSINRRLSNH